MWYSGRPSAPRVAAAMPQPLPGKLTCAPSHCTFSQAAVGAEVGDDEAEALSEDDEEDFEVRGEGARPGGGGGLAVGRQTKSVDRRGRR